MHSAGTKRCIQAGTDMNPLSQVRVTSAKLSELLVGVRAKSRSLLSGRRDRLLAYIHHR